MGGVLFMPISLGRRVFLGAVVEAGAFFPSDGGSKLREIRLMPSITWRPWPTYTGYPAELDVEDEETTNFQFEASLADMRLLADSSHVQVGVGLMIRTAYRL